MGRKNWKLRGDLFIRSNSLGFLLAGSALSLPSLADRRGEGGKAGGGRGEIRGGDEIIV